MRVFRTDNGPPEPKIPRYLYKFRSVPRALEILAQKKLHMPRLADLNDFHECRVLLAQHIDELQHDIEQRVSEKSRILSLSGSESLKSELMWAFYADNHCGVCLEFDMEVWGLRSHNTGCTIRNVQYLPELEREPATLSLEEQRTTKSLTKMVFTKNDCWCHEDEWRVLRGHQWPTPADAYLSYPPGSLTSIIFGSRISPPDKTFIRYLTYLFASDVQFKRAKLTDNNYSFVIEPDKP